jgi:hypothetical protein
MHNHRRHADQPDQVGNFLEHIAVRLRQHGDLFRGTDDKAQKAFEKGLHDDVERRRRFLLAACTGDLTRIEAYSYDAGEDSVLGKQDGHDGSPWLSLVDGRCERSLQAGNGASDTLCGSPNYERVDHRLSTARSAHPHIRSLPLHSVRVGSVVCECVDLSGSSRSKSSLNCTRS